MRDTGTGIPADELPHLFERFHRVEGARGRSIEGSGIGLALVQELVRLHGGTIAVESERRRRQHLHRSPAVRHRASAAPNASQAGRASAPAGMRAQAYVQEAPSWLRAMTMARLPTPQRCRSCRTCPSCRSDGESHRVLLADDNADMRHYVERLLRAAGYRVESGGRRRGGAGRGARLEPDLVLSDVMMPRLDGFGLLAAMREDEAMQRHAGHPALRPRRRGSQGRAGCGPAPTTT